MPPASDSGSPVSLGRGVVAFALGFVSSRVAVGVAVQLPVLLVLAVWDGSSLQSTLSNIMAVAGVIGILACGGLGLALGRSPRPSTSFGAGMGVSAVISAIVFARQFGTPDEAFVWLPLLIQSAGSIALAAGFFIVRRQEALADRAFRKNHEGSAVG